MIMLASLGLATLGCDRSGIDSLDSSIDINSDETEFARESEKVIGRTTGVDNLIAAGELANGLYKMQLDNLEQRYAYVAAGRKALDMAVSSLQTDLTLRPKVSDLEVRDMFRELMQLLTCAAEVARDQGHFDKAATYASSLVRLGEAVANGGNTRSHELAWLSAHKGLTEIANLSGELSTDKASELIDFLDSTQSSWESVRVAHERGMAVAKEKSSLEYEINSRQGIYSSQLERLVTWEKLFHAELRLCVIELAIRRFVLQNDRYPRDLGELVPKFLPDVPLDPFSMFPPRYLNTRTGYVIYSVGKDGKDDGGRFLPYQEYKIKMLSGSYDFMVGLPTGSEDASH